MHFSFKSGRKFFKANKYCNLFTKYTGYTVRIAIGGRAACPPRARRLEEPLFILYFNLDMSAAAGYGEIFEAERL